MEYHFQNVMIKRSEKSETILKRLFLFAMILATIVCQRNNRMDDFIQRAYRSDFYTPKVKIDYLSGWVDSTYFPEGKIVIVFFRFESDEPIKIREREKYHRANPSAILDFLSKNPKMKKRDIEFLLTHKENLNCLFFEKIFPADSSASASRARTVTIKKWIILWPKGKTYFGIHLRNERFFFRE